MLGALLCLGAMGGALPQLAGATEPPPIKHVFVIVLENEEGSHTFGPSPEAPYLAETLRSDGAYIPNYYGIGHNSLDNYIAMISGQSPNPQTKADCTADFSAIPEVPLVQQGQEPDAGCVYPDNVPTLPKQLEEHHLTWRSYDESMTENCEHPEIGHPDDHLFPEPTPPYNAYATRHNPFMYFNSIISIDGECKAHVVNLNQLTTDLEKASTTPNYSFITPDLCDDGHEAHCPNAEGTEARPGGLKAADKFLQKWVPEITASAAYKSSGLIIITFDEGEDDSSSCCGETPGPTSPYPGEGQPGPGTGGGDVGAVLLSPFIEKTTESTVAYNHYSMLASVEAIFGLSRLGCAAGRTPFGSDIFKEPYSLGPAESAPPCYVPPAPASPPTTTTSTTTTTTTTSKPAPAPACVATVLPRNAHGKLKANKVFAGVAVTRAKRVSTLSLTAVHAAKLKVTVRTSAGRRHTVSSRTVSVCHSYSFKLPSGHGTVTIVATVGHATQTATHSY